LRARQPHHQRRGRPAGRRCVRCATSGLDARQTRRDTIADRRRAPGQGEPERRRDLRRPRPAARQTQSPMTHRWSAGAGGRERAAFVFP
jgi:hypothetical protein